MDTVLSQSVGFDKYELKSSIYQGPHSRIFRACVRKTGLAVILKIPRDAFPSDKLIQQYRQEFALGSLFDDEHIVSYLQLERYGHSLVIVQKDEALEPLAHYIPEKGLDVQSFLNLAIHLTSGLAAIHDCDVIYNNINPSNILLDQDKQQVKYTDFSQAVRVGEQKSTANITDNLYGDLRYYPPERMGRSSQVIGLVSDLYSLGVLFYELITGQLPFTASSTVKLMHAHMTKVAVPPYVIKPTIPRIISDIIIKLLNKNVEDRYQTCLGLKSDWQQCLQRWSINGSSRPFVLATRDFSKEFNRRKSLYGREKEIEQVVPFLCKETYHEASVLFISGYSGVGKSAFVHEARGLIDTKKCYFISGKFDPLNHNVTYSAIKQAFKNLVGQVLGESREIVAAYRSALLSSLGCNARVLTDMLPAVKLIIGEQPLAQPLDPAETEERFKRIFNKFIQVFTRPTHPLILFLDDLQWADQASLELLLEMVRSNKDKALLIITANRDNPPEASEAAKTLLAQVKKAEVNHCCIKLPALTLSDMNRWLADSLGCRPVECKALAELMEKKTKGNAFFFKEFLRSLREGQQIWRSASGRWHWDLQAVEKEQATYNVTAFIVKRVKSLTPQSRRLLIIASCLGTSFDLNTLATVVNIPVAIVRQTIKPLIDIEMIVKGEEFYFFAHDKMQETVYSLITDQEKTTNHLTIGRSLSLKPEKEQLLETIFYIVDHYNMGLQKIESEEEKLRLVELNLKAARKAKASMAYQNAKNYIEAALQLLPLFSWEVAYKITFSVHKEYAECSYLCADIAQAEAQCVILMKRAKTKLDQVEVFHLQMLQYILLGKATEALTAAKRGLALLDIKLPDKVKTTALWREIMVIKFMLMRKPFSELTLLEEKPNQTVKFCFKILSRMFDLAHNTGQVKLLMLVVLKQVALSLRHGNVAESAQAYVLYGGLLESVFGQFDVGKKFATVGLSLAEKFNDLDIKAKVYFCYATSVHHWYESWQTVIPHIKTALDLGHESGNLTYFAYSCVQMAFCKPMVDLKGSLREIDYYVSAIKKVKYSNAHDSITLHRQFWQNFVSPSEDCLSLSRDDFDEKACLARMEEANYATGIAAYHLLKMLLDFYFNDYRGYLRIEQADKFIGALFGSLWAVEFGLYSFLSISSHYKTMSRQEKFRYGARMRRELKKMERWVCSGNHRFLAGFYLMKAEMFRIKDKTKLAGVYYNKAISAAEEDGHLLHEALANELAAKFHVSLNEYRSALVYLHEAIYLYGRWGGVQKQEYLRKTFLSQVEKNFKQRSPCLTDFSVDHHKKQSLDLNAVIRASQAISSETQLGRLTKKIMSIILENTGAQRGFLIMGKGNKLFIEAASDEIRKTSSGSGSLPLNEAKSILAVSIVNFVWHAKTHIIFPGEEHQHDFSSDPYIARYNPKSIWCMPIMRQQNLISILYLENNLTACLFAEDRLELLNILAAQAAISLENAIYYQQEAEQKIKEHQNELIHFSRLATAGELTSSIAHELNQPLTAIVQYVGGCLERLYSEGVSEEIMDTMAIVERQAERAGGIINNLKNFLKKEKNRKEWVKIDDVLRDTLRLMRPRLLSSDVQLRFDIENSLPEMFLDRVEIEQVIANIILNGIEAMEEIDKTERQLIIDIKRRVGGALEIGIFNTGKSILPEISTEIFNPFFTTKKKGMGMGLSICRTVIEAHGGNIAVDKELKEGARFFITLPANGE